jgi:RecA-family ATPase
MPGLEQWAEDTFDSVDEEERRQNTNSRDQEPPLPYVDLAADLEPRPWLITDRIPRRNVTLLSGEGSIGKSVILMQLFGATVLAGQWLGTCPEQGPGLYLTAEEEDNEIRHRMQAVAESLGSTRRKLIEGGLHVLSFAGRDALLAEPDRNGIIRPTSLFIRIRQEALTLRPKLIAFDAAADVFGGKEIDRAQTRQFITLARSLAIDTDSAVIMVAHPSLTGIATDTGLSGNTAWHNSVRARLYLKKAPGDDPSLRALEVKKNNYGPVTETILLRWRDGVYVAEGVGTSDEQAEQVLERVAAETKINMVFVSLLRRFTAEGRNVSDKPGTSYAPALFAKQKEAKAAKAAGKALAEAMERLFEAGKIRVTISGPPSHPRRRIVEVLASTDPSTDLPPPSTGVCVSLPPKPPQPGGNGQGAVEAAARSTGRPEEEDEPEWWS